MDPKIAKILISVEKNAGKDLIKMEQNTTELTNNMDTQLTELEGAVNEFENSTDALKDSLQNTGSQSNF